MRTTEEVEEAVERWGVYLAVFILLVGVTSIVFGRLGGWAVILISVFFFLAGYVAYKWLPIWLNSQEWYLTYIKREEEGPLQTLDIGKPEAASPDEQE
jgi:hypothetical protein